MYKLVALFGIIGGHCAGRIVRPSHFLFRDFGTSPWALNFVEMTSAQAQALVLPAGTTLFLHTPGTAANVTIGWGQLSEADNAGSVLAYAIFTQRVPGRSDQEGTSPAAASASRILVPFDNTQGAVTSMAIANSTSSSETINVGIRTSSATHPANCHHSSRQWAYFVYLPHAVYGQCGAERPG